MVANNAAREGFNERQSQGGRVPSLLNINAQYDQPMFKNYRLDWCYAWSKQCGKPAADAFCKLNGHSDAQSFTKAPGLAATRVISTSQVCDGNCDGFEQIICNP